MTLNNYRNEVEHFLNNLGEKALKPSEIIAAFEKEFSLLKNNLDNKAVANHQLYDLLFLILELAAYNQTDLDEEWARGREKKKKYLIK